MSDDATPRLSLPYLAAGQTQKHVTLNEALSRLDGLVQTAVESRTTDAEPATPADGDLYIMTAAASGAAWAGKAEGVLMRHEAGAWAELPAPEGHLAWVKDDEELVVFDGAAWTTLEPNLEELQEVSLLGVNATADAANKLAVSSAAVLFNHAGEGSQVKVNKNAAADTASHLFQTGFSGRAEFGLAGSDDFSIKVSSDGAAWSTVLTADRASGRMTIARAPTVSDEAPAALTFASSLTPDLASGRAFLVTATGDFTLNAPSNLVAGATFWIRLTQDGTGGRAAAFDAAYRFAGGVAPSLSTSANAADMLYCVVVDAGTPVIDAALRKGV
ncbi:MAG TPA: DUF2793 domain-containing protein [Caulobacteraceae bacterium]|nr:DUF2793 domain-containing protein [Caulobacteraceae bacterium]